MLDPEHENAMSVHAQTPHQGNTHATVSVQHPLSDL